MPPEGVFHNLIFVSIRKEYPGQAYKVMNGLWGLGLMSLAKVIVAVDDCVNVQNVQEAWWYALGNLDPERDVRFTKGPVDDLDHAAQNPSFGSKMGIDGTRKWPEEGFTRRWPDLIEMDREVKERSGVVLVRAGDPGAGRVPRSVSLGADLRQCMGRSGSRRVTQPRRPEAGKPLSDVPRSTQSEDGKNWR